MNQYHLQPYQGMHSRHRCPACNHRTKTFSRYIDAETGENLAPHVGRCDRVDKCGYHLSPSQYFREAGLVHRPGAAFHNKKKRTQRSHVRSAHDDRPEYYISPDYVNESFTDYGNNNFVQYLIGRFGMDITDQLVSRYRIGTSNYWHGATIFWQLDKQGYVRTGKIMLYDKQTGKRIKQPFNHITWAHSAILKQMENAPAFELRQCLFGEHLLITSPYKPVAIVESEKTAIIASALMPAFIWLAGGSLNGLTAEKCKVLQNRQVMLFPDVNAYPQWKLKALELRRAMPGTTFVVSDELERMATATDKKAGADLADVLS